MTDQWITLTKAVSVRSIIICLNTYFVCYPKELRTLGDRIRKRRLDLGLLQWDVAESVEVDETTILHWEKNRTQPTARHMGAVMVFLTL
jgi:DNA-binding XRE family transcriptional regulator